MTDVLIPGSPLAGQLRFVRYAFMPNRLQYCGGDDNRTLFDYGTAQLIDGGLTPLLRVVLQEMRTRGSRGIFGMPRLQSYRLSRHAEGALNKAHLTDNSTFACSRHLSFSELVHGFLAL